jgi:cytoskeletal protein RodZ
MSTPENPSPGSDEPGRGLSGVQRAGIVLGALAVLVIVFAVLRSGGEDNGGSSSSSSAQTTSAQGTATSTQTTSTGESETENQTGSTSTSTSSEAAVATVRVVNGQPVGGIKTVSFKKGDQVRLKVQSDVADEIHVHGYDLKKDVAKGGTVQFSFPASIEGRFEIELENAGTQIANLEVTPS